MRVFSLPQAMLPDEQHFPGLGRETPAVLGENSQENDVNKEFHQEELPKHLTSPSRSSEEQSNDLRELEKVAITPQKKFVHPMFERLYYILLNPGRRRSEVRLFPQVSEMVSDWGGLSQTWSGGARTGGYSWPHYKVYSLHSLRYFLLSS